MAAFYIKKQDGSYERVADTLGILVPQGADGLSFVPQDVASAVANGSIILKPATVVFSRGMSIDSEGFFPVKAGDVYIVKFPMMNYTGTSMFNAIVVQYAADKTTNIGESQVMTISNANHNWLPSVPYTALQDGFCRMILWVGSDVTDIVFTRPRRGNECVITKISQLSPYIIANKGALVSGGAFQFDNDGNGYTMNYPPIGEEWVVGKWFNGKPIYLQVFAVIFEQSGYLPLKALDANGITKTIVRYEVEFTHNTGGWSINNNLYYNSSDLNNIAYLLEVTSNNQNINVRANIPLENYINGTYTITVWYTKTTD
jgi:hypothetical protein